MNPARATMLCAALLPLAAFAVEAPVSKWVGRASSDNVTNANNWEDELLPDLAGGTSRLEFGVSRRNNVAVNTNVSIASLTATSPYRLYNTDGNLTLGSGGVTFSPSSSDHRLVFDDSLGIELSAAQTWDVTQGKVEVRGTLTGSHSLEKTGSGDLILVGGNGSFTGEIFLSGGRLGVIAEDSTSPLGSGKITISSTASPQLMFDFSSNTTSGTDVFLYNDFVLNGLFDTRNAVDVTLQGTLKLNADTTFRIKGDALYVEGNIIELSAGRSLTIDSEAAIILSGSANTYTGGTHVTSGLLVFGSNASIPTTGQLSAGSSGYIGLANGASTAGGTEIASFLGKFNRSSTSGTIGFDSDPDGSQLTYNQAIDLTGFATGARLGSVTTAHLGNQAVITPQESDYRFGGGGGVLSVASDLTGARGLVLDSPADLPLTVRLVSPANNFTGAVSVSNSGLIFGDNGGTGFNALPTGAITLADANSYVGHEDADLSTATFLGKFAPTTPGILGFDIPPSTNTTREIDLTGIGLNNLFTATGALGTASAVYTDGEVSGPGVRFTGTISAASDGVHRFAAYKGGALQVAGTLTGNSLEVGRSSSLGAFGDPVDEEYSVVAITGDNGTGLAGGTTLYTGHLVIGQSNGTVGTDATTALGSGTLTVQPHNVTARGIEDSKNIAALISAGTDGLILSNNISLAAERLDIGGDNALRLTGTISGSGELYLGEESTSGLTVTLSSHNTFAGGVYVSRNTTVLVDHNNALGTGPLAFGVPIPSDSPIVKFSTTAPVLGGLSSPNYATLRLLEAGTTLTINQPSELEHGNRFVGAINTVDNAAALLVKSGPGTLRLEGKDDGDYDYGFYASGLTTNTPDGSRDVLMEVRDGRLVLGKDFTLSDTSSTLWVNGGDLVIDGASLSNPILASTGRFAGHGSLPNFSITGGASFSPGALGEGARIGSASVNHVTFGTDAILEWDIASTVDSSLRDHLNIGATATLEITATTTDPWVIRPVTLSSIGVNGLLDGFDATSSYSWELLTYQSVTGLSHGLNPPNVLLDLSMWSNATAGGTFNLEFTSISAGGQLLLNFTPVPEPSTYALMGAGLALVGWQFRRRRRT